MIVQTRDYFFRKYIYTINWIISTDTSSQTWNAILSDDEVDVSSSIRRDPLEYWKANKMVYPRLASLARKYHSAPPGSAQ